MKTRYIRTCVMALVLGISLLMLTGCFLMPDQKMKNFQKITVGMTSTEAINKMGIPKHTDPPAAMKEGDKPTEFYIWESKRYRMVAGFQEGKVVNTGSSPR